jgi:hypothetical protein
MDDYAQIRELYAQYCWTLDERRFDEWLHLFTEDGVVEGPNYGRHVGPPQLRQFIAKYKATTGMFQVRHMVSSIRADIQGDTATGSCYVINYRTHRGRTELSAIGGYRDKLRKVNGQWLFSERQAFWDYSGSNA